MVSPSSSPSSSPFRCKIEPFPIAFDEFRKVCLREPTNNDEYEQIEDYIYFLIKRLNAHKFNDTMSKTSIMDGNKQYDVVSPNDKEYDFVGELITGSYARKVSFDSRLWFNILKKKQKDDSKLESFKMHLSSSEYIPVDVYRFLLNPENKKYLELVINELEEYENE